MPDDFGQQRHETICCPDIRVLTFKLIVSANWILVQWEVLAYPVGEPGPSYGNGNGNVKKQCLPLDQSLEKDLLYKM